VHLCVLSLVSLSLSLSSFSSLSVWLGSLLHSTFPTRNTRRNNDCAIASLSQLSLSLSTSSCQSLHGVETTMERWASAERTSSSRTHPSSWRVFEVCPCLSFLLVRDVAQWRSGCICARWCVLHAVSCGRLGSTYNSQAAALSASSLHYSHANRERGLRRLAQSSRDGTG
jgi:hypothetical protein